MLRNPTVFILGAGASAAYGYPTGRELVQSIVTDSLPPKSALEGRKDFEALKHALANAKAHSVDIFLGRDKSKRFEEVGTLAIAEKLILWERHGRLFFDKVEDDWYEYLFHTLFEEITDINDVAKIPVSFVTFNYDRSLEHFLYTYLLGNFADAVPSDVVNVIGRLPIIHVYGSLGPLPWQDADGRDYSPTISPEIVAAAAKGITILHQGNDDSPEFQQAQELFKKADSILLLGFGYPRENMHG